MKVAIIGLGAAAQQIHLPALKKDSTLEIVAGVDVRSNLPSFDFPVFESQTQLYERTTPNLVIVATPTQWHYESTKLALENGCHVLVEKPFMSDLEEADKIIELSNKVGRWVIVNNQYRFMNIHEAAYNQIDSADFGELLFISANQTFFVSDDTESGWRGNDPQRTCKEFGIHVLDLCRYYFKEEPLSITARMPKGKNPQGPDYLNLLQLEFSEDRVAHITLDRLSRGPHRYLDMRLDGSKSVVETSVGGKLNLNLGIRGGTREPYFDLDIAMGGTARLYKKEKYKKLATDPIDLFANATYKLLLAFQQSLKDGTPPPCDAESNRKTLALMLAAYESASTGKTIYL